MAVGKLTKKNPFAQPLMIANVQSGPSDALTGQIASMLKALMKAARTKALMAPMRSHIQPPKRRPMAVAAPNPATSPAPVEAERPIELAKSGYKWKSQ